MTSDTCAAGKADSQQPCCSLSAAWRCQVPAIVKPATCPSLAFTQLCPGVLPSSCIGLCLPEAQPSSSSAASERKRRRGFAAASRCPQQMTDNCCQCPPAARPGLWPRHLWRRALATCTTCTQATSVSEGAWLPEALCRCGMKGKLAQPTSVASTRQASNARLDGAARPLVQHDVSMKAGC